MADWWWSYLLTGIGLFGLWRLTRKDWRGYVVGASVQLLWIGYAIATEQYGFIIAALAYCAMNVRRIRAWGKDPKPAKVRCSLCARAVGR